MIAKLRHILGLQTAEEKLEEYTLLKGELIDINNRTDILAEDYVMKLNGFNDILKSEIYGTEIKERVQKRYTHFLQEQKKEVIGLVNRRHKIEKSISSILKDEKIKDAVIEFELLEKAKSNYRDGNISKNVYNDIIKAKKGKVHYSDNFVFWNGKLLLIQRATDDEGANKWGVPGGHVDAGESHEDAAVRELQEETGLVADKVVLAGTYSNDDVMIEYYTSHIESDTEPQLILDTAEHQSYKWIDLHKDDIDKFEFPFNMKENIKKLLLPKEENPQDISKAVNLFIDGFISKSVLSDIVKARSGVYKNTPKNRKLGIVGQKYGNVKAEEKKSDSVISDNLDAIKDSIVIMNGVSLYRGDIRDKGDSFSDSKESKDYISGGEAKNKAGFHWFSSEKSFAKKYATEQLHESRGKVITPIVTEVKTKDIKILDLTNMGLKDQVNFHVMLQKAGITGLGHNHEKLIGYDGDYSQKSIDRVLGYKTYGKILNNAQSYSDGDTGVVFKKWLQEKGVDGYRFKTYIYGDEIGLVSKDNFSIKKREYLNKQLPKSIEKAFEQGLISKDVLEKARSGKYADTPENRRLKRVGDSYGTKKGEDTKEIKEPSKQEETTNKEGKNIPIDQHARQSSETALQEAAKGGDEELRLAAKKELERREKEESVSDQPEKENVSVDTEKRPGEEKPPGSVEQMKEKIKELRAKDTDDLGEIENISKEIGELIQKIKQSSEKEMLTSGKVDGLSEAEVKSIIDYTGNDYKEINRQLRNGKVSKETQEIVNKISSGLSKLPEHKGKVFRGMAIPDDIENVIEKWKKGGNVTMEAFTSTSTDKNVALRFGDFQIEIDSKTGRDISKVSEFGKKENEVLFDINAKFQVKSLKVKKVKTPFGERIISISAVIKEI